MMFKNFVKIIKDMEMLYGDKTILTITDGKKEYSINGINGVPHAKYFEPSDNVAEVTIIIKQQ